MTLIHRGGFDLNAVRLFVASSDDPLPRQSTQAQAAEDILDKYRNIKRPSPSDGATAGAAYDGTGGQEEIGYMYAYWKHLHMLGLRISIS